jgi:hypothetical protein
MMRAIAVRQKLAKAAAVAVSAALVAACSPKAPGTDPGGSGSLGSASPSQLTGLEAGALLISDGSKTVTVGGKKIVFTTTVTDAVWSPDGSRIAFVDGDGNIASARPDGSGVLTLTHNRAGIKRSRPAWSGSAILFTETDSSGKSLMWTVGGDGSGSTAGSGEHPTDAGEPSGDYDPEVGSVLTTSAAPGRGKELAFQRSGASGPEVWVADLYQRSPYQSKLADGSEPALSLDGMRVAYVANGQINVIATTIDGAKPTQITTGIANPTHLVWSPDGLKITFSTSSDVESVPVQGGAPQQVSTTPGAPTYLGPARDKVTRIVGKDPVATSVAASRMRWPSRDVAQPTQNTLFASQVLVAGTSNYPVTIAGAQMIDDGPLLLTGGSSLDPRTAAEIKRVLGVAQPDTGYLPTVNILGGTDTVSASVESAIKAMGYDTHRTSAKDPYTMAVTVSGKPANAQTILVVDQADLASYASAISDLGAYSQQTVLLTNGSSVPDAVRTFLNGTKAGVPIYTLGTRVQDAVNGNWPGGHELSVTPIGGTTSPTAGLLNAFGGYLDSVVVVNAANSSDVLAAIGLARGYGALILAVDPKAPIDPGVASWLLASSAAVNSIMVVDSTNAIGADLTNALGALVCGPLGFSATVTNPVAAAPAN